MRQQWFGESGLRASLFVVLAALPVLSGCSVAGLAGGLSPTLNANDVERASDDRQRIMSALQADAGGNGFRSEDWYEVTLAGFNYVDDQCTTYFDNLFKLNRQKDALKSGLSAFGQTTNAILAITGAAQVTMTIVAQAFGLASSMTDIVAGTFLYELPPATTKKFVDETMHAYKVEAQKESRVVDSRASAYGKVRGYLNLCLPATIEGKLVDHIGSARAVADSGGDGADIAVRVISDVSVFDVAELREPKSATETFEPAPGPTLPTSVEKQISNVEWAEIQQAVCIKTPDGKIGKETREAIIQFFLGGKKDRSDIATKGVQLHDLEVLREVVKLAKGKECTARGFLSAFEVGQGFQELQPG